MAALVLEVGLLKIVSWDRSFGAIFAYRQKSTCQPSLRPVLEISLGQDGTLPIILLFEIDWEAPGDNRSWLWSVSGADPSQIPEGFIINI